ncbi:FAD-dependent oxidoreductase [Vallicoccus soli]|uniref:D-amino-acid oxidase n=1 Tax=Vallicoccus soli TaxID=2339232 RepID=A0A3A3ZFK9_9ACTN|nr:FAD-dependent oxidoreductase [Vallicoccus soli]RJK93891.1 FAD-binding oxidoreductase [Vallicoccus soli]
MRVTVVGAGVVGLTVAHELAAAGHAVRVLADADAQASTSGAAAALWFPHGVPHTPQVLASAAATYRRLVDLARDPATGVRVRAGTVLSRRPDPDRSWTSAVPEHRVLGPGEAPAGASGVRCTVPLAVTGTYLAWLQEQVRRRGVALERRAVGSLAEVEGADAVVVAGGVRSPALLGDDRTTVPVRGQVARLANPGLTEWVTDDDNPDGLTYVVPRDGDVVCGGTGDVGAWDRSVDPAVEDAVLRRVRALVPALADRPVLSRAVGLRPGRPDVRLEPVEGHGRPVVACYGHGGAGFTLSWGDAGRVVRLLEGA